jgi:hypothetical protein
MPLPYWHADASRSPLIIVHLVGRDAVQQPDVQSLIRIVDGLIEKRERIVVVYDITDSRPDAQRRQLLVTWLRENNERLSHYVVASAIVAPTAFLPFLTRLHRVAIEIGIGIRVGRPHRRATHPSTGSKHWEVPSGLGHTHSGVVGVV